MRFGCTDGCLFLNDKDRLTHFGRFLRSTSLDELPELFNVFCGNMSIVGPRPLLIEYLNIYTPEQAGRHKVKPGITGWAQVNGRNSISWREKFEYDLWYVSRISFSLDMKILIITIMKLIKHEGISEPGHATMEPFHG
jgi:lipopolysaccharide/colanic/teichoic acid biosynthesis glycosyltransferase